MFVESERRFFIDIVKVGAPRRAVVTFRKKSLKQTKKHLPRIQPLAHHSSRVITAQPSLEILPATATSPQKSVGHIQLRFLTHGANAFLEVEVGPLVAAPPLEEIIDGHVEAVAQQTDVSAARLMTAAGRKEVHMTNRLLQRRNINGCPG